MDSKEEDICQLLSDHGYTLDDFMQAFSKERAALFRLPVEAQKQYDANFDALVERDYTVCSKGKLLENLTAALFCEKMFIVRRNCRTSTNEIDILLDWSDFARECNLNTSYPCFGDSLLCECKNYDAPVDVTYIGKFASLLISSCASIGIMVAWEGVTGSGWNYGSGLIKKLALAKECKIIVLDRNDLERIRNKEKTIYRIVHEKNIALTADINYQKYIERHEAQDQWSLS